MTARLLDVSSILKDDWNFFRFRRFLQRNKLDLQLQGECFSYLLLSISSLLDAAYRKESYIRLRKLVGHSPDVTCFSWLLIDCINVYKNVQQKSAHELVHQHIKYEYFSYMPYVFYIHLYLGYSWKIRNYLRLYEAGK